MRLNLRSPWVWSGLMAVATFLPWLSRLSSYSDQMGLLARWSYDWAHAILPGERVEEAVVVTMDEKSFREIGRAPEQLWPRSIHAQFLRQLTRDGVRVVVMDVFFAAATESTPDEELAQAMRAHQKVAI